MSCTVTRSILQRCQAGACDGAWMCAGFQDKTSRQAVFEPQQQVMLEGGRRGSQPTRAQGLGFVCAGEDGGSLAGFGSSQSFTARGWFAALRRPPPTLLLPGPPLLCCLPSVSQKAPVLPEQLRCIFPWQLACFLLLQTISRLILGVQSWHRGGSGGREGSRRLQRRTRLDFHLHSVRSPVSMATSHFTQSRDQSW